MKDCPHVRYYEHVSASGDHTVEDLFSQGYEPLGSSLDAMGRVEHQFKRMVACRQCAEGGTRKDPTEYRLFAQGDHEAYPSQCRGISIRLNEKLRGSISVFDGDPDCGGIEVLSVDSIPSANTTLSFYDLCFKKSVWVRTTHLNDLLIKVHAGSDAFHFMPHLGFGYKGMFPFVRDVCS